MKDDLVNRLARHRKVLTYLDMPSNAAIWQGQPPVIFTTRAATLRTKVDAFGAKAALQGKPVTWEQQNVEEKELEDHAFPLSNNYHEFLMDAGRAEDAKEWRMSLPDWQALREQTLLDKAHRLIGLLTAELAATPTIEADYAISAAGIAALQKEWDDFDRIINAPDVEKGGRKALTASLRPDMREIDGVAKSMDRLVTSFGGTPEGDAFVAGYFAVRSVDDRGHGPGPGTGGSSSSAGGSSSSSMSSSSSGPAPSSSSSSSA